MSAALDAIDASLQEVTTARILISKIRSNQIRGADQLASMKSLAYAWFNTHRKTIEAVVNVDLSAVSDAFQTILNSTDKSAAKQLILERLHEQKTL